MDRPTIQSVRSHGAALNCRAFELADRFLDAFFAHCPHLRTPESRFRGTPDRQRRAVAHQWAWFVRNLGQLDQVSPELDALAAYLRARGVQAADLRVARTAMLEALRDISGDGWTARLESDWACAMDCCLSMMSGQPPLRLPDTHEQALAA